MVSFPFSSQPVVGVDIQPHEIKLVQLRKTRQRYRIEKAIKSPPLKDWDGITTSLSEMVQKLNLTGMPAAISLPTKLVRMQYLQLPSGMTDAMIEAEIMEQVKKDFPGMNSSLSLDYAVTEQKTGYSDIFFVIARTEQVTQYIQCIKTSGLKLKVIDVDIYALKRIFDTSLPTSKNDVHVKLIQLQRNFILIIADNQEILLHHEWDGVVEWQQVENRIQIFIATFPHKRIHNFAMYGNEKDWLKLAKKQWSCHAHELDLSKNLRWNPHVRLEHENICEFLVACGSAMREMPRW